MRLGKSGRGRARLSSAIFTDYGFASFWLMPRVADFRKLHPGIEVHVVASQGLDGALDGTADAAILFGRKADFPDDARLLMPERVVPVCSPGFRARFGPFPDAEALARQPLLHLDTAGRPRWFTWTSWLAAQGVAREPAQGDLGLNTYGFVIQAATAEQGVALGWLGLVDAHLANGTLVAVGPEVRRDDCGLLAGRQPARQCADESDGRLAASGTSCRPGSRDRSAPFAVPHRAERQEQQAEAEEAAEQRHAETDFSTLSLVVLSPIQSLPDGIGRAAHRHDAGQRDAGQRRRCGAPSRRSPRPPGAGRSSVETVSANSGALTGPTWASADRSPLPIW